MKLFKALAQLFHYLGSLGCFARDTVGWLLTKKRKLKDVIREIVFIGIDSLPLVSLISFFIGIIIAFQTAYQLRAFRSEIQLATLVALSMVRELGPVIGALIVAARSGASITAGIGSMKISEQVDALEAFGVNPLDYLVVPKFLALFICMPILIIYADCLGIIGGYLVGTTKFSINLGLYFRMTFQALSGKDILSGLVKSISFGSIIAFVSCYEGFRPFSSIDVSRSVTHAVVRSFILIIVFDCILTAIFYFVGV
ncbi:MAG: ABC transporter permease [Candidatus Omnitrophica bacterium]|nr:ABC transporter permease [Candidatus Omnitrophota bacterium]MBU2044281.1 ABC transporter permease [Candidatus Omnitrophota bacterium]MBU2266241.1 ABC transporter permease [Candidatus Omnitrophota bacterium]MBU2473688.1 ABC transporter permease [Candidatus Omnitrophota bacterium]